MKCPAQSESVQVEETSTRRSREGKHMGGVAARQDVPRVVGNFRGVAPREQKEAISRSAAAGDRTPQEEKEKEGRKKRGGGRRNIPNV